MTAEARPVPTYPDLAGKVALVTGGSRGIGAATCRMLGANGVRVAVSARSQDGIDAMVAELEEAGAEAVGINADAVDRQQVEDLVARTERELGSIDILLPYAGGFDRMAPIEEVTDDYWRDVLENNLTATFLAVSAVLPSMTERGGGAIVTMASNAGRLLDMTLTAPYAAAKAGVIQFTRHVAMEVGRHGIRINAIAPATVSSERVQRIMDTDKRAKVAAMSPLGTMGTPEDCALATLFLVSDSASWLTGVTLDIAGGRIML
jgi:3-oxoacyl-[acyl-carrier protein] reductase